MIEKKIVVRNFETQFFILTAKLALAKLRQAFGTTPIFHDFDPKSHMWIEMEKSSYVIDRISNKLTLGKTSKKSLLVFFF